jgi:hypothetical protein
MEYYKNKYLKYKNKYLDTKLSLKGGNPYKKILLMFLGGAISAPNLIKHYKIMNEEFKNKNNYYIVIHPISLPYEVNEEFKRIFNHNNIFIVDEDHHLLTAWATKSLSDATLMMMQYAHTQNSGNLFDKYVLLSPNCCPIYTFDKIYDYLTLNNKSFINFSNGAQTTVSNVEIDGPRPKIKTGSQWMILDKQHIQIFFPLNNSDMYNKEPVYFCEKIKKNIETIKINSKYETNISRNINLLQRYFKFFNDRGKCNITDEIFFQTTILYYIFNYNLDENPLLSKQSYLKNFNLEHCVLKKQLYLFNFYNTQYNIFNFPEQIKEKLKEVYNNLNKTIIYIYPLWVPRDFSDVNYLFENLSNPLNDDIIKPNTYTYPIDEDKIKKYIKKSYGSTNTDWLHVSIEPLNFLRDFEFSSIINTENIINYLQNNPINNFCDLNKNIFDCKIFVNTKLNCIKDVTPNTYPRDFRNCIKQPYNHPLEYSYWNIKSVLNSFILINKLKCLIAEDFSVYPFMARYNNRSPISDRYYHVFHSIYHIYKKILIFYFDINDPEIIKNYNKNWKNSWDKYDILDDNKLNNDKLINMILAHEKLETILEIKLGTYITHNTLISAMCNNSLFIRKCYDTSLIEEYSHILKDCDIIDNQDDKIKIPDIECVFPTIPMYSFDEDFALQNLKK